MAPGIGLVPWGVLAVAALLLGAGWSSRRVGAGETIAVLSAAGVTLGAWAVVPHWGLHHLYELVPAFGLAGSTALVVSRLSRE